MCICIKHPRSSHSNSFFRSPFSNFQIKLYLPTYLTLFVSLVFQLFENKRQLFFSLNRLAYLNNASGISRLRVGTYVTCGSPSEFESMKTNTFRYCFHLLESKEDRKNRLSDFCQIIIDNIINYERHQVRAAVGIEKINFFTTL